MRVLPLLLLILASSLGGNAQLRNYRMKNGIRLAGGTGPKGRLELSSLNSWFNNYTTPVMKAAWNAICDEDFDEFTAVIMCTLLGYSYGRKAYDFRFSYRKNVTAAIQDPRIGKIRCTPRTFPAPIRGLRGTTASATTSSAWTSAVTAASSLRGESDPRVRRALYMPLLGTINVPSKSPYTCSFDSGKCDPRGPLAGIECSHTPLPPAPQTPRSPPAPPPFVSGVISLVGGRPIDLPDEVVEPNLGCSGEAPCGGFGRLELLVPFPSGTPPLQWAPVCALEDTLLAWSARFVACQQILDWPDGRSGVVVVTTEENAAFEVPSGPVKSPEDFDPAHYSSWVRILGPGGGPGPFSPRRLQDFNHTVTSERCGALLAVQCQVFGTPSLSL